MRQTEHPGSAGSDLAGPDSDGLLAGLLTGSVSIAESFGPAVPGDLLPEEQAVATAYAPGRRLEFSAVRGCVRDAMRRLGAPPAAVVPNGSGPAWTRGAPRWPPGLVGSLTHCRGYRAAVVARRSKVRGLGIDAEPFADLDEGPARQVLSEQERSAAAELAAVEPAIPWPLLLFSAKESAFKAWAPLTGRPLDFAECTIELEPMARRFVARVPAVPGLPRLWTGRWTCSAPTRGARLLVTAVEVPAVGQAQNS